MNIDLTQLSPGDGMADSATAIQLENKPRNRFNVPEEYLPGVGKFKVWEFTQDTEGFYPTEYGTLEAAKEIVDKASSEPCLGSWYVINCLGEVVYEAHD